MYEQTKVNEPIQFYDGPVTFFDNGHSICTKGTASVTWLPLPQIEIKAELEFLPDSEKISMKLPGYEKVQALPMSWTTPNNLLTMVESIESVNKERLQAIEFPLVNGPEVLTPGLWAPTGRPAELVRSKKGENPLETMPGYYRFTCETAQLLYGDWQINLVAAENRKDMRKSVENSNGYGFLYQGRISKLSNTEFLPKEADSILKLLSMFLSFLRGAYCNFPILRGINKEGQCSWQRFSSAIIDSGRKPSTWFISDQGSILSELFEKFCALCQGCNGESFKVAQHWYKECNKRSSGIESAIILGLTALELMSSLVLVAKNNKGLSATQHKRLSLEDKLVKLLEKMHVPLDIPAKYSELKRFAQDENWSNSCKALIKIRHSFVHSKNIARNKIFKAHNLVTFQAWQLSLWYQELALLYLLDHQGRYRNRITAKWSSDGECVPWK